MNLQVRAVSLDLDNTLWDVDPVLARAEAALMRWLAEQTPRLAAAYDGRRLQQMRAALAAERPELAHDLTWLRTETLRRAALATGYPESVAPAAFEVFIAERNTIEPFPEVVSALARLAARVPLYALTNGNACVRRVGIGEYFTGSIDAASAGAAKPDPVIYARLVDLAAVPPGQILHVGDDAVTDVEGARRAGMRTVWMNRGSGAWPAGMPRADHEVSCMAALAELVDSLA